MRLEEGKEKFIEAWGMFGSSWGINKAMAQIHALLLLSPEALSTDQIMEELQISRGNANMNIHALMDWGLCHKKLVKGDRKEYFYTSKDIYKLAQLVVKERRKREVTPLINLVKEVSKIDNDNSVEHKEYTTVVKNIDKFFRNA